MIDGAMLMVGFHNQVRIAFVISTKFSEANICVKEFGTCCHARSATTPVGWGGVHRHRRQTDQAHQVLSRWKPE